MDDALLAPSTLLGAVPQGGGRCLFEVWAPSSERVTLVVDPGGVDEREVEMQPIPRGYHIVVPDAEEGRWTRVLYSSEERWDGPGARASDELGGGSVVAKVRAGAFALYVLDQAS